MARFRDLATALSTGVCIVALAAPAQAQERQFNVPAGSLKSALDAYVVQSGTQLIYQPQGLGNAKSKGVSGKLSPRQALDRILAGSGFRAVTDQSGALAIVGNGLAGAVNAGSETASSGGEVAPRGVISGQVLDQQTGAALKGALVEVVGGQQTSTDDLGEFRFAGLTDGTYQVRISYLGYGSVVGSVSIGEGRGARRKFELAGGDEAQVIIVQGQRSARAQALNQERTAENVSTVLSSDLLGNFTGTTLAESLRKAPGVVFERSPDTGDGTNVAIRGLAPDFNTVKLNGVELPEGSGVGRSATLGNILTESISKVTISKTLLPNQDSSGTGGLIEIETKSPFDRPARYASFTVEGATRANDFGDDFLAAGTISGLFGAKRQFGLSLSVQHRNRSYKRVSHSESLVFPFYFPLQVDGTTTIADRSRIDPRSPFPFEDGEGANLVYPQSLDIFRAEGETKNLSITASGAWAIGDHTKLFVDYQRINQTDTDYSSRFSFAPQLTYRTQPVLGLGGEQRQALEWSANRRASLQPIYQLRPDNKTKTDILSFRGESELGKWSMKYAAGYADGRTTKNFNTLRLLGTSPAQGILINFNNSHLLPEATNEIEGRVISPLPARAPGDFEFHDPLLTEAGFALLNDFSGYRLNNLEISQNKGSNKRYNLEYSSRFNAESDYLKYVEFGAAFEKSKFRGSSPPDGQVFRNTYVDRGFYYAPLGRLNMIQLGLEPEQSALSDIGINTAVNQITRDQFESFVERVTENGVNPVEANCSPIYQVFIDFGLPPPAGPCPAGTEFFIRPAQFDPRLLEEKTTESELAAYIQTAHTFGDFEVVGGARMTKVKIQSSNLTGPTLIDATGIADVDFQTANSHLVNESASQTDILPRFLMNYRPTENFVARLGYFLSVARPQIELMSKTPVVLLDQRPNSGPNGNQPRLTVQKGNPDLKPAITHNFDFSAELYDKDIGVIKFGAFYKRIKNLLESTIITGTGVLDDAAPILPDDPRFQEVLNNPSAYALQLTIPQNNPSPAKIWGIEATIERQFTFLPGFLSGLGIYANYTYTHSSKKQPTLWQAKPVLGPGGNVTGLTTEDIVTPGVPFNGQAPHSGSLGLTYSRAGLDASLIYTKQARRQLSFAPYNMHQFEESYGTLDLRSEYTFSISGKKMRVYLEGADLLRGPHDASIIRSQGADDEDTPKYFSSAAYFGGRQIRVGANIVF